jgi:hypothetical protein
VIKHLKRASMPIQNIDYTLEVFEDLGPRTPYMIFFDGLNQPDATIYKVSSEERLGRQPNERH